MNRLSAVRPHMFRIAFAAGLLVVVVAAAAWLHRRTASPRQATVVPLEARVVWTSDLFRIANTGSQTWLNCQFVLNRSDADGKPGYILFRDRVLPREVLQVAHAVFTDPAGQKYRYDQNPPTSFFIRCENVGGDVGVFSGKYER